jgi:hypothetical protein
MNMRSPTEDSAYPATIVVIPQLHVKKLVSRFLGVLNCVILADSGKRKYAFADGRYELAPDGYRRGLDALQDD